MTLSLNSHPSPVFYYNFETFLRINRPVNPNTLLLFSAAVGIISGAIQISHCDCDCEAY